MCLKVWGLKYTEQLSDSVSVGWGELDPLGLKGVGGDGNERLMTLQWLYLYSL